jgi:hypothetical protein
MAKVEKGAPAECKVGQPSNAPRWTNPDCVPFDEVTHTTHISHAVDILRHGRFSGGLVYDESHLNKDRIPVVWLSPNRWNIGYRYGNVQFAFPWSKLLAKTRAYWVEIARYQIAAPRILLTERDHDDHPNLTPYDPTDGNGPWWFDGETHHFNSKVCVEFMLEGNLPLKRCSRVGFVDHHARYCCAYRDSPSTCRELGKLAFLGATRFLARVATEGVDVATAPFDRDTLAAHCSQLLGKLAHSSWTYNGATKEADVRADSYARALLSAYANYRDDDRKHLASLFSTQGDAETACRRVLAASLGRTEDEITEDE